MSNELTIVNSQIASIDTEITNLNNEITQIDAATIDPGCTELLACVAQRRANLVTNVTSLTNFKTTLEAKKATLEGGWSAERQTVVDGISTDFSGNYDSNMNELLKDTSEKQTEFFTMYDQADTTFLKELAIKEFFHL